MISLKNVTVDFETERALNSVSFHVEKGQAISIIGPSGSGKSTLLNVACGLIEPSSGTVETGDGSGMHTDDTKLIMQSTTLFPWMTVRENIAMGLRAMGHTKVEIYNLVREMLLQMDLNEHGEKYPSQLSGGQAQRAAIARIKIMKPGICLFDEPTSALDAMTKESIQDTIRGQHLKHPYTSVLVTHSIEEAVYLGQVIYILDKGQIVSRIENPTYGMENARQKSLYYEKVMEIRKTFREVSENHEAVK